MCEDYPKLEISTVWGFVTLCHLSDSKPCLFEQQPADSRHAGVRQDRCDKKEAT